MLDPRRDLHPRSPFTLQVIRGATTASVMGAGELRQAEVTLLTRCVRALGERGVRQVVIDLTAVGFVSPTGRRALARIATDVADLDIDILLYGLHGPARRQLAERHARTRIRPPRIRCSRCLRVSRIALQRRG
jgi:anti-anti-sigma regulatory factor